jgi:predicted DCC family thiol-disulfide oxidoreductase YuxK
VPAYPLEIYYDGNCSVCSAEIATYRRRNPQQRLEFIDIRGVDFSALSYGKTEAEFLAKLHVRDARGEFATGVDAFLLIWQAFPDGSRYRRLAAVVGLPGIKGLARCGYFLFARYRRLLPKARDGCRGGICNPHHRR